MRTQRENCQLPRVSVLAPIALNTFESHISEIHQELPSRNTLKCLCLSWEVCVFSYLNAALGQRYEPAIVPAPELLQNGIEIIFVTGLSSKQRDGLVWHSIFPILSKESPLREGKSIFHITSSIDSNYLFATETYTTLNKT